MDQQVKCEECLSHNALGKDSIEWEEVSSILRVKNNWMPMIGLGLIIVGVYMTEGEATVDWIKWVLITLFLIVITLVAYLIRLNAKLEQLNQVGELNQVVQKQAVAIKQAREDD